MLYLSLARVRGIDPDADAAPEPRDCVLTESTVCTDRIFIHRVGRNGRLREAVLDRHGHRLSVPVDTDDRAFHALAQVEMPNQIGHFAFIARDHRGRFQARRDFWLYRTPAERAHVIARRPTPEEQRQAALDAALRRCEATTHTLAAERQQRAEAEQALERAEHTARVTEHRIAALSASLAEARADLDARFDGAPEDHDPRDFAHAVARLLDDLEATLDTWSAPR